MPFARLLDSVEGVTVGAVDLGVAPPRTGRPLSNASDAEMREPVATVIVCTYNRTAQTTACLDSILEMDFADFEVVVVDDASTDDTPKRLADYQKSHPDAPIRVCRCEHNRGVSGARNFGVAAARGQFVFFTDSDCVVDRRWLTALVEKLRTTGADAVAGVATSPPPTTLAERAYAGTSCIKGAVNRQRPLCGGNMGFRREIAREYPFDQTLTYGCDEDDLAWRLRADGHMIAFAPDAIVRHVHPLTLRSYLRQGRRHGMGAARYWYKRGIYVGRDLWALAAAIVTLGLGLVDARLLVLPVLFAMLQLAALAYNERVLKGKTGWETARVLPVCALYSLCKASSVLFVLLRLAFGGERAVRESKRRWQAHRRSRRASAEIEPRP